VFTALVLFLRRLLSRHVTKLWKSIYRPGRSIASDAAMTIVFAVDVCTFVFAAALGKQDTDRGHVSHTTRSNKSYLRCFLESAGVVMLPRVVQGIERPLTNEASERNIGNSPGTPYAVQLVLENEAIRI
jgi:hypothetical protein